MRAGNILLGLGVLVGSAGCASSPRVSTTPEVGWLDEWTNSTVALGVIVPQKVNVNDVFIDKQVFIPIGTGVLFGRPDGKTGTILVTAKHVFQNPSEQWAPQKLWIRFSWFDVRPVEDYTGIPIDLIGSDGKQLWTASPNAAIDLAAIALQLPASDIGRAELPSIPPDAFATADDIYQGEEAMCLGYPGATGSLKFWSRPLLRRAVVAWSAPTHPDQDSILLDGNVIHGNSGGPAFIIPTGMDRSGRVTNQKPMRFLGIVSETRYENANVLGPDQHSPIVGPNGRPVIFAQSLIGIGVVEPAGHVRSLLDQFKN